MPVAQRTREQDVAGVIIAARDSPDAEVPREQGVHAQYEADQDQGPPRQRSVSAVDVGRIDHVVEDPIGRHGRGHSWVKGSSNTIDTKVLNGSSVLFGELYVRDMTWPVETRSALPDGHHASIHSTR